MVRVYFESYLHAELVATFETEELYNQCLPMLEAEAKKQRMTVTETIDETFDVKILWGSSPEDDAELDHQSFNSQAELDAYMKGVESAEGWMGYEVMTDKEFAKWRKDRGIEPETYIDSGHAEGTFEYSRSEAIAKIKEIAKQDSEFNWDIYNMSEDDVLEIGHNHYSINLK